MFHLKDQLTWRVRIAWGRRRAAEGEPAPPLSNVEDEETFSRVRYPYYQVYNTQEEALAQTAIRNRGKDLPTPFHPADTKETVGT
jgi:hypothetical protein